MKKCNFKTCLLVCVVSLLLGISFYIYQLNKKIPTQILEVKGISQPVEILIDKYGVPHIYANTQADVFFAQGFNIARDRLFQIDLSRRRGLGELAEVFGESYVEQDKAARLFLYQGDMKTEWESYAPDAYQITHQFVAGINAYIDWLNINPELLPAEFKKLNYLPDKWHVDDVVRIRSHVLTHNIIEEVQRAQIACQASLFADSIRLQLQPQWQTQIPDGLDPCLPKDVLNTFNLATQRFELNDEVKLASGSNAWVIAPEKSATQRAIFASDPHRAYSIPSLRYISHLNTPTLNIIGAGEPELPAIATGHNGKIAFGYTFSSVDQEDLYVYELNPNNLHEYLYQGKWEPLHIIEEQILVKDKDPILTTLFFTRHGPVIYMDNTQHRAYAVRATWLLPGGAPYFGSISLIRAQDFNEFKQAADMWHAPPENLLYADVKGNIGWVLAAKAPIRPNWDGLLPVPGDGRYEWQGFWSQDELPFIENPLSGYFVSANEMNLPKDYPYQVRKLGFEWPDSFRYLRINSVLAELKQVSIEDTLNLQNDIYSYPAQILLTLLSKLTSQQIHEQQALDLLSSWDGKMNKESAAAALHEIWLKHLGEAFKSAVLSQNEANTFDRPDMHLLLDALVYPETWFANNPIEIRDQLLLSSLGAAYIEMIHLQGNESTKWQWGNLLHLTLEHPLSPLFNENEHKQFNVSSFARDGSRFTPNLAFYRSSDFQQIYGPSVRVVIDVGEWDNSKAINFPGQSGNAMSPHYRDMISMWEEGQYFPLLYSRSRIEEEVAQKIILTPLS